MQFLKSKDSQLCGVVVWRENLKVLGISKVKSSEVSPSTILSVQVFTEISFPTGCFMYFPVCYGRCGSPYFLRSSVTDWKKHCSFTLVLKVGHILWNYRKGDVSGCVFLVYTFQMGNSTSLEQSPLPGLDLLHLWLQASC